MSTLPLSNAFSPVPPTTWPSQAFAPNPNLHSTELALRIPGVLHFDTLSTPPTSHLISSICLNHSFFEMHFLFSFKKTHTTGSFPVSFLILFKPPYHVPHHSYFISLEDHGSFGLVFSIHIPSFGISCFLIHKYGINSQIYTSNYQSILKDVKNIYLP